MLRMIFVTTIILIGTFFAAQSAFYGLLFYMWNAYFRPDEWTYGGFILSLRLSLIIGAYVVIRTLFQMPDLQVRRTALIWLFFVQAFIGTYTSEQQFASWVFFSDYWKVLLISYLIVVLVQDRKQFRMVLIIMALSLGFETAKQGWANLYRNPGGANTNTIKFLGDNNGVALGLMMILPIFGALSQTATRHWERNMYRFVAVGVFLRGISTYSRGGFLGAGALAAVTIFRAEKKVRAILAVGVLAWLIWAIMPQEYWARMDTITVESEDQRDDSAAGRLHFWTVAVDMANAKPFTGVGLNAFSRSFPIYNTDERFTGQQRAAHSIWFGVLGDLGYTGLILFGLNLGMAFWWSWRTHRLTRKDPELRDLRIFGNALIGSLVVYSVAGSFLSHQYNEMAWHMMALCTALHLIAQKEIAARKPQVARKAAA